MKHFIISFFIVVSIKCLGVVPIKIERIEPMFWWTGMKSPYLQLLVYGENISNADVSIGYNGVDIEGVCRVENQNYLFIDLVLGENVKPGNFNIVFDVEGEKYKFPYQLRERKKGSVMRQGFNSSDVVCLITPDRFSNGDPQNDYVKEMLEKPNRFDKDGRHGGDLRGIINSIDYLHEMGYTAIWLNPVFENNMEKTSYHGYAITDFYKVDPRFGTNREYVELSNELKKRGMKLIMDMVFNHCGSNHWWMKDLPMKDWVNNYPNFIYSSHQRTVNQDPYRSRSDYLEMTNGWFDSTMPDLNQRNEHLKKYLIQNSIWWIEYAGLSGIRQDTYPYPDKNVMAEWTKRVLDEYPYFNIVGEEWSLNPAIVSYWQKGQINRDGYMSYLPSVMDFPLQNAVVQGLVNPEGWGTGLIQIYEALANDFLYPEPTKLVIFPDNHDMSRFYVQLNEDVDLMKMGIVFFLTTRGIPQIFYGTEILMTHKGNAHGDIRADFPGGWKADEVNAYTGNGLTQRQKEMQKFMLYLLNWRKNKRVIHNGKMMHFVPNNGIYTYFRYNDNEKVMIVLNKNDYQVELNTGRFAEIIEGYTKGVDIISKRNIESIDKINVPKKSAMIIELRE